MSENQTNITKQANSKHLSGYGLALELAKKIRAQGQAKQTKSSTTRAKAQSKDAKK